MLKSELVVSFASSMYRLFRHRMEVLEIRVNMVCELWDLQDR